jgi:hypothetical protein
MSITVQSKFASTQAKLQNRISRVDYKAELSVNSAICLTNSPYLLKGPTSYIDADSINTQVIIAIYSCCILLDALNSLYITERYSRGRHISLRLMIIHSFPLNFTRIKDVPFTANLLL